MRVLLALALATALGCGREGDPDREVRALLDQQSRDWNAGDLDAFMNGYWRSDQTRFNAGGDVSVGWQTVLDRYRRRYTDRAAMGQLAFTEIQVTPLSPGVALATGRWRLQRAKDAPSGLFTLLLRRTGDGWRIVHDHTSAAEQR
jgi:ketosteroid isomerase-like protein